MISFNAILVKQGSIEYTHAPRKGWKDTQAPSCTPPHVFYKDFLKSSSIAQTAVSHPAHWPMRQWGGLHCQLAEGQEADKDSKPSHVGSCPQTGGLAELKGSGSSLGEALSTCSQLGHPHGPHGGARDHLRQFSSRALLHLDHLTWTHKGLSTDRSAPYPAMPALKTR